MTRNITFSASKQASRPLAEWPKPYFSKEPSKIAQNRNRKKTAKTELTG
jgi:hypothetical protein